MANLLNLVRMTLAELRELARKHLGRGHSRLKSRAELIAALKQKLGDFRAKSAPTKAKSPAKPKAQKKQPARRRSRRAPTTRAARVSSDSPPVTDIAPPRAQPKSPPPAKILSEAFFAGVQPSTGGPPPAPRVHAAPGLPEGYGSDDVVAINRGPGTLFVFWDFGEETIRAAARGLADWRLLLRVFRGPMIARELPIELAHGRAYLEDLPIDSERVELYAVGSNGSRRIAGSNVPHSFHAAGPSLLRLADLGWDTPLSALPQATQTGAVRVREQTEESAESVRERVAGAAVSSSPVGPWGEGGEGAGAAAGAASPFAPWGGGRRRFGLPSSR